MQVEIQKHKLLDMLQQTKPFLLRQKQAEQFVEYCFLMRVYKGIFTIKTTNGQMGIEVAVSDVDCIKDGKLAVLGKTIAAIVANFKDGLISIQYLSFDGKVHFSQGRSSFALAVMTNPAFPPLIKTKELRKLNVDTGAFVNSLELIIPTIDTHNPKPELNNALLEIKRDKVALISTDTRRISISEFGAVAEEEKDLIIPREAMIKLRDMLSIPDTEVLYDENVLVVKNKETIFSTKLTSGAFPRCRRIFPEGGHRHQMSKEPLLQAIKEVSVVSEHMDININKKEVFVKGREEYGFSAETRYEDEESDIEITFSVKISYMSAFLKIANDTFTLIWSEDGRPIILEADGVRVLISTTVE